MADKKLTPEQQKKMSDAFTQRMPQILKCDPIILMDVNGIECKLYIDNKAVADFYKDTGVNLIGKFTNADIYKPDVFPHLMHRSLQKYHPDITLGTILSLDFRKFMYYRDRVMTSIEMFIPDVSDVEAEILSEQEQDPTLVPVTNG